MVPRGNYAYEEEYIEYPADKAMAARNAAYKRYCRHVQHELIALIERNGEIGVKLRKFAASLGHFGADDGEADRMVLYVRGQCRSWLREAPQEIRVAALHLVSQRCAWINLRRDGLPFNDPLPGDPDDTYRLCRREIGV
jgi:hypothetical protein